MNEKPTIETKIKESVPLSPEVTELAEQDLMYKNLGDLYSQKSKVEALLSKTPEASPDREALIALIEEINGLLDIENTDRARVRKGEDVARLKEINRELPTVIKTIKNLSAKKDASKTAKEKRDIDIELGGINRKRISLLRERALLNLGTKDKGIKVSRKRTENDSIETEFVDQTLSREITIDPDSVEIENSTSLAKIEPTITDTETSPNITTTTTEVERTSAGIKEEEIWTEEDEKELMELEEELKRRGLSV